MCIKSNADIFLRGAIEIDTWLLRFWFWRQDEKFNLALGNICICTKSWQEEFKKYDSEAWSGNVWLFNNWKQENMFKWAENDEKT